MSDSNQQTSDADMASIFDDATFNSVQFDNYSNADSPFDPSRYFNLNTPDSPEYQPRTPSKNLLEQDATVASQNQQNQPFSSRPDLSSRSVESSSQASSSESSVRRKRKTTSESPPATTMAGHHVKQEMQNEAMDTDNPHTLQHFGRSLNNLSLDQDMLSQNMDMGNAFDFDSAASSPGAIDSGVGVFNPQVGMKTVPMRSGPPAGTVEPAQFFLGSTGASPSSAQANTTAEGSPAMFPNTTPSSAAPDMFTNNQMWNSTGQTPGWSENYNASFASPGALGLTPSPETGASGGRSGSIVDDGLIPLHIGAIPAKSRVETQINIRMTIDRLPPGVNSLHLPTHTIAKAKLLSKEVPTSEETLELHTMLVCTSAMNQPKSRENALKKAAAQDNTEIQSRRVTPGEKKETEEVEEDDKPINGGEVRICGNCINRERKRAARKKLKKEEEQAHWEKYETERVIVFNTNEHKTWLDWQPSPPPKDGSLSAVPSDLYAPSETAMQITAPMRIACYCRHQNEKDGFQVIFTLKDSTGKVVAQALSDSILITDDHKTHPMAAMNNQVWYDGQFPPQGYGSQSMVELHSHMPISKSTGNLQNMAFAPGGAFHHSSSVHHMPSYASQNTSGTMTPGSMTPKTLSRPASPNSFTQAGPSKKRKSSGSAAHRRVPSGLTMTKVDTQQQPMTSTSGAMSNTPFSPTSNPAFNSGSDNSAFMNMPQNPRSGFNNQSSTPGDPAMYRNLNRATSLDQNGFQAFYSAPNSAHQSRAASPVLSGPNLTAFQRQHGRPTPFSLSGGNANSTGQIPTPKSEEKPAPIINKVVPSEGPTSGGIEVSIYGQNFVPGMEVVFGDRTATATTYWGEKALCCVLPPSSTLGPVHVGIAGRTNTGNRMSGISGMGPGQATFRYTPEQSDTRMMEMALRFYCLKMTGTEDNWQTTARDAADMWMNAASGVGADGLGGTVPGAFPS